MDWSTTFQQNYQIEFTIRLDASVIMQESPSDEMQIKELNKMPLESGDAAFQTTFSNKKSASFPKD